MPRPDAPHGRCISCNVPLLQRGGLHNTDLCGPCCTGESATLRDMSAECAGCGTGFEFDGDKLPHPTKCLNCLAKG